MYSKGRKKGTVRFVLKPDGGAHKVAVAGDFSDWKPVPLGKGKSGAFVRHVPVSQETFEYKFIVDGQWMKDPDNSRWAKNPFGTFNSVAPVDEDAALSL